MSELKGGVAIYLVQTMMKTTTDVKLIHIYQMSIFRGIDGSYRRLHSKTFDLLQVISFELN